LDATFTDTASAFQTAQTGCKGLGNLFGHNLDLLPLDRIQPPEATKRSQPEDSSDNFSASFKDDFLDIGDGSEDDFEEVSLADLNNEFNAESGDVFIDDLDADLGYDLDADLKADLKADLMADLKADLEDEFFAGLSDEDPDDNPEGSSRAGLDLNDADLEAWEDIYLDDFEEEPIDDPQDDSLESFEADCLKALNEESLKAYADNSQDVLADPSEENAKDYQGLVDVLKNRLLILQESAPSLPHWHLSRIKADKIQAGHKAKNLFPCPRRQKVSPTSPLMKAHYDWVKQNTTQIRELGFAPLELLKVNPELCPGFFTSFDPKSIGKIHKPLQALVDPHNKPAEEALPLAQKSSAAFPISLRSDCPELALSDKKLPCREFTPQNSPDLSPALPADPQSDCLNPPQEPRLVINTGQRPPSTHLSSGKSGAEILEIHAEDILPEGRNSFPTIKHGSTGSALARSFYQIQAPKLKRLMGGLLIIQLAVVLALIYQLLTAPRPRYFGVHPDLRLVKPVALNLPHIKTASLVNWTGRILTQSLTLDFAQWSKKLQSLEAQYSPQGFSGLINFLETNGYLQRVIAERLNLNCELIGSPLVTDTRLENKRYVWQLELPVLLTFHSSKGVEGSQKIMATVLVQRTEETFKPLGVEIKEVLLAKN
jgi:intracellular multiplication protein IcmL